MLNRLRNQLIIATLFLAACSSSGGADLFLGDVAADRSPEIADQWIPEDGLDVRGAEEMLTDLPHPDLLSDMTAEEAVDTGTEVAADLATDAVDLAPELPAICGEGEPCDDGEPCTVDDQCDGEGECAGSPMQCDDDDPCTDGDACADGECVAGENICECTADEDCAEQEDGDFCNGTLFCDDSEVPYECAVDLDTISTCALQEGDGCNSWGCVPESGECILIPMVDGTVCDDANQCTDEDVCSAGVCAGTPKQLFCAAGTTYCVGESVCLCDECGHGCEKVVKVCTGPAHFCVNGSCLSCQPNCGPDQCGDDGCGGSCGTCPGTSTCSPDGECLCDCPGGGEPVCNPLTGTTYASVCAAACEGIEETQPGPCGATCYTPEDAVPAEVGLPVADFFCKDANMNSPGLGGPVSAATLKETIWIAYFGACT